MRRKTSASTSGRRQIRDAEMRLVRRIEARARGEQHMLVLEQIHRELLIAKIRQHAVLDSDERIDRAARCMDLEILALRDAVENGLSRLIQAAARSGQLVDALIAAERRLHCPLPRHVAAQTQRRKFVERAQILARRFDFSGERDPTDAITAGSIHLRKARQRCAQRADARASPSARTRHCRRGSDRRFHRRTRRADAVRRCAAIASQRRARIDRAGRVIRIDDDDRARAARDQRFDFLRIGFEPVLASTRIVNGPSAIQIHCRGPQRIVGAGYEHFIVRRKQRTQHEIDELADPVADIDLVGGHTANAAALLLHAQQLRAPGKCPSDGHRLRSPACSRSLRAASSQAYENQTTRGCRCSAGRCRNPSAPFHWRAAPSHHESRT